MHKTALAIILAAIGLSGYIMTDIVSHAMTSVIPSYNLVMTYHGDSFVVDHDMTITDCVDALPRNDPFHDVRFSCDKAD